MASTRRRRRVLQALQRALYPHAHCRACRATRISVSRFNMFAHHGYEATLRRIAQRLWWRRGRREVSAFVKSLKVGDFDRNANPLPHSPLNYLPVDQHFGTLYIDIVGGQGLLSLEPSSKSNLTMIYGLTDWADEIPIAAQSAATCAGAVYAIWIAHYILLEQLHSDRGKQFESALIEEL